MSGLVLTGERTLPGIEHENYWLRRHEAAYAAVAPLVQGLVVLDAGSGEGYGAALLRRTARAVLAIELDEPAAAHARATYAEVSVVRADVAALPVRPGSVDAVVSLQTLEHLHDQAGFLAGCARVLAPGGLLALSTPNAATFPPGNAFHTHELELDELVELLAPHVAVTERLGVRHGARLVADDRLHGPLVDAQLARPEQEWDDRLRERVARVRASSFSIGPATPRDLDLLVVARRA